MPRRSAVAACLLLAAAACAPRCAGAPDAAAAGCSRERPCANYGSCELHTGACACPLGFGGRLCEKTLLGACALTPTPPPGRPAAMLCASGSGVVEHGQVALLSCDCLRQCVAHEAGGLATHGPCYERPGGPAAQLSSFPAADEAGVVYRMDSAPGAEARSVVPRDEYMQQQARNNRLQGWEALPLRDCNASCSFEGVCLRDPGEGRKAHCWCHYGFDGDACDVPIPDACINACSGHGTCIRGFCSCQMARAARCVRPLASRLTQRAALAAGLVWHRLQHRPGCHRGTLSWYDPSGVVGCSDLQCSGGIGMGEIYGNTSSRRPCTFYGGSVPTV